MTYGRIPFSAKTQTGMYEQIQTAVVDYPDTRWGPINPELREVIQMMLVKDPTTRPTIDDIRVCACGGGSVCAQAAHGVTAAPAAGAPVHLQVLEGGHDAASGGPSGSIGG